MVLSSAQITEMLTMLTGSEPRLPVFTLLNTTVGQFSNRGSSDKKNPYPGICIAHMVFGHTPSQEDDPCAIGSYHHVVQCCNI